MPQTERPASEFDTATAVTRGEGAELRAVLDPGWAVGPGILNGGYLLAVVARAAATRSPHPHPVALSASYLRATAPGRARLTVTPGPVGRTLAHGHVLLAATTDTAPDASAPDAITAGTSEIDTGTAQPSLSVQVTTTTLDRAPAQYSSPMPSVAPPEDCLAPTVAALPGGRPMPEVGLRHRVQTRLDPDTAGWALGRPGTEPVMRAWVRLADGAEPDPFALLLFADALPPTSWAIGRFGWAPTVQLQVLVRALPAPGWCLVEARANEITGGWLDEDYRIWDAGGRLVAQSRQLARLPR